MELELFIYKPENRYMSIRISKKTALALARISSGDSIYKAAKAEGVAASTLYRALKKGGIDDSFVIDILRARKEVQTEMDVLRKENQDLKYRLEDLFQKAQKIQEKLYSSEAEVIRLNAENLRLKSNAMIKEQMEAARKIEIMISERERDMTRLDKEIIKKTNSLNELQDKRRLIIRQNAADLTIYAKQRKKNNS